MKQNKLLFTVLCLMLMTGTAFGQISGMFVAAGNPAGLGGDKEGMIGLSGDGTSWEFISLEDEDESLERTPLSGLTFGNGRLVAVGGNKIIVSEDGKNWRLSENFPERMNGGLNAVAFGNGMFVAVGGTSSVTWSKDGLKWQRFDDAKGNPMTLNSEIDFGKTHLYGIVFHDGKFYALGNGDIITVLVPGKNGLSLESSVMKGMITSRLNDMVVDDGKAVVVGTTEDYLSTDMIKWKKIKPWQQYFAVCHGAGNFVAVSGYGQVFYSPTAESGSWKEAGSAKIRGDAYFSVAFGNGTFVAGSKGQFSTSKDGVSWKTKSAEMRFKKIIYIP
ncbi:MAG: hypothetical protein JW874_09885 [Spirochaetales bacterium]|nr:hypothetical protein [Spirochaetales bacterium]